jgi:site-specific recombinase XerC
LCEWLMRQHYFDSNPWDGVPDRAPSDNRIQIDRALPLALWQRLWQWLEDESAEEGALAAQMRVVRAAVAIMRDSGPRLSEACGARREKLRRADDAEGDIWELTIVGKRNKQRTIPVSGRTIEALRAH